MRTWYLPVLACACSEYNLAGSSEDAGPETVANDPNAPWTSGGASGDPRARCEAVPPVAGLGADLVTFSGRGSSDPSGRPLAYDWRLVSSPAGSSATLPDGPRETPDRPGFRPDVEGAYTAELTVTDVQGRTDTCEATTEALVLLPIAVCSGSPDPAQALNDVVTWSGVGSTDPAGSVLTYAWTLVSAPAGSSATLSDGSASDPERELLPDVVGVYVAELVVTNAEGVASEPCRAEIEAIPAAELWVEMFWSGAGDDMDLHVVRDGGRLRTFDDCYYANCRGGLSWAPPGADGDPILDVDDISGTGPENINMPEPDNVVYSVWVHDFPGSVRLFGNDVTVNVYLGGTLAWTATETVYGEDRDVWFADIDWATQIVTP